MRTLIILVLAILPGLATAQTTTQRPTAEPAPTRLSSPPVCVPAPQARIIAQALQRFEKLKPAYLRQVQAGRAWQDTLTEVRASLASQAHYLSWYKKEYAQEQALRQTTGAERTAALAKDRRRGWLVALEAAALAGAGYLLLAH